MADYETFPVYLGDLDTVAIPQFQRGYVWNSTKKNALIETLHNGFPFGSLLTYQGQNGQERLLDGQQRLSTIRDFRKRPLHYWKQINKETYSQSFNLFSKLTSGNVNQEMFDKAVSGEVKLADWVDDLSEAGDLAEGVKTRQIRDIVEHLKEEITNYLDVEKLTIPLIRYKGPEENVALVFENLNKGGSSLTKFEIYAAAWVDKTFELSKSEFQDEILQLVKQYYLDKKAKAEELDFELADFSEDDLTTKRVVNLFEFGLALGLFIKKRLPTLVRDNDNFTNSNEIGFGVLVIYSGADPKRLENITKKFSSLKNELEALLQRTDKISVQLNDVLSKLIIQSTTKDGSGSKDVQRKLNTSAKTLSYFASLWDKDYGTEEFKQVKKNIPAYYVYDSITSVWTSHGDQRLFDFYSYHENGSEYQRKDYTAPVDVLRFKEEFKTWIKDENQGKWNFSAEVKALATIHANLTYLSAYLNDSDPLEFEHIYAKERINVVAGARQAINLGSLGNAMFLPRSLNNGKKLKTLYETEMNKNYNLVIENSEYPSEDDFEYAFEQLHLQNFGEVNAVINKRALAVANSIIDKLTTNVF